MPPTPHGIIAVGNIFGIKQLLIEFVQNILIDVNIYPRSLWLFLYNRVTEKCKSYFPIFYSHLVILHYMITR